MNERTRTRVRRLPKRAAYDRETVEAILDEALVCHLGFVDGGHPVVIPTLHARDGDLVYVHGSAASRTLRALAGELEVCLTVTLLDGLVLARSAFHHSVNYRSAVLLGRARLVEDSERKLRALEAFTEQIVPGRWRDVRSPSPQELKATTVLECRSTSSRPSCGPVLPSTTSPTTPTTAGPAWSRCSSRRWRPRMTRALRPASPLRAT